jgi:retron-type reverse transcriptase
MQGAPSVPAASEDGRNDGNEYSSNLLEKIVDRNNLNQAYKRVKANRGSHGVDGMKVDELLPFLKAHGAAIRQALLEGNYVPAPVRRKEIPKPGGGIRLLKNTNGTRQNDSAGNYTGANTHLRPGVL